MYLYTVHVLIFQLISIVLCALLSTTDTTVQYNISNKASYVHVKWVWLFVRKGLPFHYFNIIFDATFNTSSEDITLCKYLQINSLYFPTCEKCDFKKCQVYFEWIKILNHSVCKIVYILLYMKHFILFCVEVECNFYKKSSFNSFLSEVCKCMSHSLKVLFSDPQPHTLFLTLWELPADWSKGIVYHILN